MLQQEEALQCCKILVHHDGSVALYKTDRNKVMRISHPPKRHV